MSKHQPLDTRKWQTWAFVGDNDMVCSREYVIANLSHVCVMAASNTTVILERMVRHGRVEWYDKQKRDAIRRQFKRGGMRE